MTTRAEPGTAEANSGDSSGASRLLRLSIGRRAVPVTVVLLVGYLIARIVSTGFLALLWKAFPNAAWSTAYLHEGPDFLGFLSSWDTRWYEQIALHGYPTTLPVDGVGDVTFNNWAFYPVFPGIVRGVMSISGLGFDIASIVVAVIFGAAATIALYRVLLVRFQPTQALWGALFFAFGPMSFILQVGYAESTFLLFMFISLELMLRRRYLAMIPFAVIASFTHPGALALAAALGLQGLHRIWRRHPISPTEWFTGVAAIAVTVAAGLGWPLIAAAVTGDSSAYFDTELAWWRVYFGRVTFIPFTPFFLFYGALLGVWGVIIVVVVLAAVVFWLTRRSTRAYGADLWTYTVSYIGYLVAVFLPTGSLIRQLLPLSPLLGHPGLSRTRRRRIITLAASIALQPVAIFVLWVSFPP